MTNSLHVRFFSAALALMCPCLALAANGPVPKAALTATPTLTIADASTTEGNSGPKSMNFTATLSATSATPVTLYYYTGNGGNASVGMDYVGVGNAALVIPAGSLSGTFSITILGDTVGEGDEYFSVNPGTIIGATFEGASFPKGTILNDDALPALSIGDVSVKEGNSGNQSVLMTVSLPTQALSPITFDVATSNGTAMAGTQPPADYLAYSAIYPQSIGQGESSVSFWVNVIGDTTTENDETFTVNIINPSGATIADGSAVVTIVNDDGVSGPTLSIGDASIKEGDTGTKTMSFPVTLSQTSATDVLFDVTTADGTASSVNDYVAKALTGQRIPAGTTTLNFTVAIQGDTSTEPQENFRVNVNHVIGAVLLDGQATGTIDDNDGGSGATLSVSNVTISEGDSGSKTATFTVQASVVPNATITYDIATSSNSAVAGEDFVGWQLFGETLQPGQVSKTYTVTILGDTTVEADETFSVIVARINGAGQGPGGAATILNDDTSNGLPLIRVDGASLIEGNSGTRQMLFNISLSKPATVPVSYRIGTSDQTAASEDTPTVPLDYYRKFENQTIPVGGTGSTFVVAVQGDTRLEVDEYFGVDVVDVVGAVVADASDMGRIIDDENQGTPTLAISDAGINEGDSGTKTLTFTVTLTPTAFAPTGAVTFDIATANGTATAGSDYVALSLTNQSIPLGQTTKPFAVTIKGDTQLEENENFSISLSNVTGGVAVTRATAVGSIINDDDPPPPGPWISIADVAVAEGNSGTKTATFTATLSAPATSTVSFDIATVDGTATAGSDYVAKSLTGQTIAAGQTSKTFTVTINGDTALESDEFFSVNLSNVTGALVDKGTAKGTITNDDGAASPELTINNAFRMEGTDGTAGSIVFTVSLSAPPAGPVTYNIATADDTAVAGSDYVATSLAGETIPALQTQRTFTVPIIADAVVEPDEDFIVNITNVSGATVVVGQAFGVIGNDDAAPVPSISITGDSAAEGNGGTKTLTFTVSLSVPSANAVSFDVATANGTATAGSDYVAIALANQSIPAGQTSKTFNVTINGDTAFESDETFAVNLTNITAGTVILSNTATGTIVNDDAAPAISLSIGDITISEGDSGQKLATYTVSLSSPVVSMVRFDVTSADGTATAGSDYVAESVLGVTLTPGQSSFSRSVPIKGDTAFEPDETFFLNLGAVEGAGVTKGQATVTITNDDSSGGGPTLSIGDVSISEGNSGSKLATFTLTLSAPAATAVTYNIATAAGTATAPADFVNKSQTGQSIAAGQTSKTFTVSIKGDTVTEPDETFFVNVTNVTGATLADGQAVGTITNDDGVTTPTLSIADVSIAEGNSGTSTATFTVSLSAAAAGTVTYDIATSNGTATAGTDYVASSLTGQSIAAGQTSKTFSVTINGDTTVESDETFTVTLSNPSGATIADGSATGTITNDDSSGGGPTLSIGDVSIAEGNSGSKLATFTLTLSAPAATAVTYNIATAAGTATAPADFVNKSQTGQSIAAGQTSKTFTVSVKGDTVTEPDETFFVNVSNVAGATLADGQAVGTITNDDGVTAPTLSIADVSIAEGNSGSKLATFTLTLSAPASSAVTYDIATSNGTATAGSDYVASSLSGQSIAAGATSKTFSVTINGDTTVESDETFTVTLSNPGGATIADGSGEGTITNDDGSGSPTLSIGDVSIAEGNGGTSTATFTVSLSAAAAGAVSYDIATSNGTATAGSDYVAASLSGQSIPAGQTSKTFSVTINGDTTVEPDETFTVALSNPTGATIADGSATGTITNDDTSGGGPALSIGDVTMAEGNALNTQFTFTVSLSAASASAVSFNIATADGSAIAGSDYTAKSLSGQTIAAGQISKTFVVLVKGDRVVEPNETFQVNVTGVTGATVADGQAIGTITNDDAGLVTIARVITGGLVDDIDEGNRAPLLTRDEYALLLLDTAKSVCDRAQASTVVGIDGVENKRVLEDLADAANALCPRKPRYAAVFNEGQGSDGRGFLVDVNDGTRAEGVRVLEAQALGKDAKVSTLTVLGNGHDKAMTVLLTREAPTTKPRQAGDLDRYLAARRKLDPESRLVVLGANGLTSLVDASARAALAQKPAIMPIVLPTERIFVSQSLLDAFGTEVILPSKTVDSQVLELQP